MSTFIAAAYDIHVSSIAAISAKTCKLVFGPYIQPRDYNQSPLSTIAQIRSVHPHWRIQELIWIIRTASVGRNVLTVYGLERVKVSRDRQYPFLNDWSSDWGNKWLNRRHTKKTYGPQELLETVLHHVIAGYDEDSGHNRPAPRPSIFFKTIEEYTATQCDDELLPCELEPESSVNGKWLFSKYWKSKVLWQKSAGIPELGDEDHYESDTDEENPALKQPRPPFKVDLATGSTKCRRNRRAKERKLQKLKADNASAFVS
jgi:hypothetical protein